MAVFHKWTPPRNSGGIPYVSTRLSLSMKMSRLTRDGTAEPVSRDQILRHARGQGNIIFPVQLTTSRISNLTRLIHTLPYVMTIHTHIRYSTRYLLFIKQFDFLSNRTTVQLYLYSSCGIVNCYMGCRWYAIGNRYVRRMRGTNRWKQSPLRPLKHNSTFVVRRRFLEQKYSCPMILF